MFTSSPQGHHAELRPRLGGQDSQALVSRVDADHKPHSLVGSPRPFPQLPGSHLPPLVLCRGDGAGSLRRWNMSGRRALILQALRLWSPQWWRVNPQPTWAKCEAGWTLSLGPRYMAAKAWGKGSQQQRGWTHRPEGYSRLQTLL